MVEISLNKSSAGFKLNFFFYFSKTESEITNTMWLPVPV